MFDVPGPEVPDRTGQRRTLDPAHDLIQAPPGIPQTQQGSRTMTMQSFLWKVSTGLRLVSFSPSHSFRSEDGSGCRNRCHLPVERMAPASRMYPHSTPAR